MGEGRMMQIGELAKRTGTNLRTLRYYEEVGLITASRTRGGFRLYSESEAKKLEVIRALRSLGVPICEIKSLFQFKATDGPAHGIAPQIIEVLGRRIRDLDLRIAEFQKAKAMFQQTLDILGVCATCNLHPSPDVCYQCRNLTTRQSIPPTMEALMLLGDTGGER